MIVTISNEYGAGAVAIASDAARELGYELVDEQLPVVVAKRLGTSPEEVDAAENARRSVGERIMSGLELATPEMGVPSVGETFDERCVREVQSAVREYAAHGNAVIVGRGANQILGRRPDVLRVFMHAPRAWRIAHIATAGGVEEKTAKGEVDRIDAARRSYLADWYDAQWGGHENYDLSIDTSSFGRKGAVGMIVGAVRERA